MATQLLRYLGILCTFVASFVWAFNPYQVQQPPSLDYTIQVGFDTTSQSGYYSGPAYIFSATSTNRYSAHAALYTANELNGAIGGVGGTFTAIRWNQATGGYLGGDGELNIWLKHVDYENMATAADWDTYLSNATLVYQSNSVTFPQQVGWVEFAFNQGGGEFVYSGLQNLLVITQWYRPQNAVGATRFRYSTTTGPNMFRYRFGTAAIIGNDTMTTRPQRSNIQFEVRSTTAVARGTVTAAAGGAPIESVLVRFGNDSTYTNASGYYQLNCFRGMLSVIATKASWNRFDTTLNVSSDTVTFHFTMTRPLAGLLPSAATLSCLVGDSVFTTFTLANPGDGAMQWNASLVASPLLDGVLQRLPTPTYEIPPLTDKTLTTNWSEPATNPTDLVWDTLAVWNVDLPGRSASLGAEYFNGYVYVSNGSNLGSFPAALHKFAPNGTFIDSIYLEGGATAAWGLRDMASDGDYIYGGWNDTIKAFDPTTGRYYPETSFISPLNPPRALAYDPVEGVFYVANFSSPIYKVTRSGTFPAQYTNTLAVYGLAWWNDDPDSCKLYIYSQNSTTGSTTAGIRTRISKLNTVTGQLITVIPELPGSQSVNGNDDIAGGCFISSQLYPGYTVFGGVLQGQPDRLSICQLTEPRWSLSPLAGSLTGNSSIPLSIGFRSLPSDNARVAQATLRIQWTADELLTAPITINVQYPVPGIPQQLVITYLNGSANLGWEAASGVVSYYNVYRYSIGYFSPPTTGELIATVSGTTLSYVDTNVSNEYYYRVTAGN